MSSFICKSLISERPKPLFWFRSNTVNQNGQYFRADTVTSRNHISKGGIYCNKAKLLLLKLIHLFATEVLLVKKLEIKETKTTWYSIFKTDIIKVGLVFSISNFLMNEICLANKWMSFSCSSSALCQHECSTEHQQKWPFSKPTHLALLLT